MSSDVQRTPSATCALLIDVPPRSSAAVAHFRGRLRDTMLSERDYIPHNSNDVLLLQVVSIRIERALQLRIIFSLDTRDFVNFMLRLLRTERYRKTIS